jgi:hypothetical protein
MTRVFLSFFFCLLFVQAAHVQPRFKGKRSDTTQTVLGDDTTIKKLIQFKDSIATVGPDTEGPRAPAPADSTGLVLLIVGSVLVIVWAGRRAWMRQRKG